MGNDISKYKINFEDMQNIVNNKSDYLVINTLDKNMQTCLISNTINISQEEQIINELLNSNLNKKIVIYGKNSDDEKIYEKLHQLHKLGFTCLYVYSGGLFEWLLLQDIYGNDIFPTTKTELDILKYKPLPKITAKYLTYN